MGLSQNQIGLKEADEPSNRPEKIRAWRGHYGRSASAKNLGSPGDQKAFSRGPGQIMNYLGLEALDPFPEAYGE
jgi:hypothetical protein